MSEPSNWPNELGEFLRARRAALTPDQVGLATPGNRRRVVGLRREEVAQLASISVDYLTRLEQGRVNASAHVLETLARALRLGEDQQTYLYAIAGKSDAMPSRRRQPQRVRPAMQRLLDQLTNSPAIVLGRRMDVIAWNSSAASLFTDFAQIPAARRNYIWLLFTNPTVRSLHATWAHDARDAVAALRMEAAREQNDPRLAQLVGELSIQDPDFRQWWGEHRVNGATYGTKQYRHPVVGNLSLDCDVWDSPDGSGQKLMVLTADVGTPSYDALQILASWAALSPSREVDQDTGDSSASINS